MSTSHATAASRPSGLGTFSGVFTPSVLTILGLILFRRMGYVVGSAGILQMVAILAIAHAISILTSTSLSAIATNMRVKGGGDYYLISRSLGVEFGGALGIVLYLAQSISVAFYCIGLGEAVELLLPPSFVEAGVDGRVVAAAAVVLLFTFAWAGSDWATRLQYLVMAALIGALTSFALGGWDGFSMDTLRENAAGTESGPSFWVLFALFFPAVTGFTQGVSMSGDLKDPQRSLPRGTFAAVFFSLAVYVGAAVLFLGNMPADELAADYEAMDRMAVVPWLVTAGLVAATLSSALASFMGAPRILQALASDRILTVLAPFAKGSGPANNPRAGVALTLVIALGVCALGGVDVIAPIVSMFFLISYGLLNYATALEARAASPSFRPRFRWFHHRTSLLGAVACLGVMLMINAGASALALALLFALYQFVQRVAGPDRWADSRRDHYFHTVRKNLRAMSREPVHARNWRPHLLVFSDAAEDRGALVRFAAWIEGGAGMTTVVRVLEDGSLEDCRVARKELEDDLESRELEAFALAVSAPDREQAAQTLVQSHGLGPIRTNTILLSWRDQRPAAVGKESDAFLRNMKSAARLGVNVIVFDGRDEDWAAVSERRPRERRIDVWWSGNHTGRLMLLLAYMTTRADDWHDATIRLVVPTNKRAQATMEAELRERLAESRIEAEVRMVTNVDPSNIVALSRDASLVLLPLRTRAGRPVDIFGRPVEALLDKLPSVALVSAVDDIALDADPEQGGPGQKAALEDALAETAARLAEIDRELPAASTHATDARRNATAALASLDDSRGDRESRALFQQAAAAERQLRALEKERERLVARAEQLTAQLAQLAGAVDSAAPHRPTTSAAP